MITLEQIQAETRKAAAKAAKEHRTPVEFWPGDLTDAAIYSFCRGIPFLGDYIPRGYKRVSVQDVLPYHLDYFFVDATGAWENTHYEAALSIRQFRDMLRELYKIDIQEYPTGVFGDGSHWRGGLESTYSLGIWEAGKFQVHIALYRGTQW